MYNSVIVGFLVNIWHILEKGYEHSLLKKFNDKLIKGAKLLSIGSLTISLFTSSRSLIEESLLYKLYCFIIDIIVKVFRELRRRIKKVNHGSLIYTTIYNLFYDEIQLQSTFYIFFIAFGIGIIGNNLVRGYYSGRSYLISIALISISLIGLKVKEDYKSILEGSYIFKLVKSIFTIDEGVEQWW